eukprot:scaffold171742_cov23-Tisochrysis_lutea.AAC.1
MSHPAPPACNTLRFLIASRFLSLLYLMLPHYCIPCLQCIPIPHFPTLLCLPAGPVLVAKVSKGGMVLHSGSATGVLPLCAWQGHLRPRSGGGVLCRWVAGCAGCVGRCSNKDCTFLFGGMPMLAPKILLIKAVSSMQVTSLVEPMSFMQTKVNAGNKGTSAL